MSETSPFIGVVEPTTDRFASVKKYAAGALLLASVSAIAVAGSRDSTSSTTPSALSSQELTDIRLELSNDHTSIHGNPATDYIWLEDGTLVEPGKLTNIKLSGIPDRFEQKALTTSCEAVHTSNGDSVMGKAGNIECDLMFLKPGSFEVQTTVHHDDLGVIGTVERTVISRYVRRDIRKLSSTELASFMNAARTMYDVGMEEGLGLYGPNYKSMSHFVSAHLKNSVPDKHHDYMHDGMGFLTQHISITNEFELALQVVDSSVALPYWDFTQDFTMIKQMANEAGRDVDYADLWTLDVWGDDYFGNAAGSSLHTVTQGRWAYTRVPKVVGEVDTLMANGYGFMRAPWNLQSSPYITRYHSLCDMSIGGVDSYDTNQWPNCKMHHSAVFEIDSYAEYLVYNAYIAHAGVHLLVGGSGGSESSCDTWSDLIGLVGPEKVKAMKAKSFSVMRNVWRSEFCIDPSTEKCDGSAKDGDTSECKLQCEGCELDQFTKAQQDNLNYMWRHLFEDLSDAQVERVTRQVFCESKVILGEQIEASSAVDISFWPIHPTMERLIQYKQLVNPFTDYTWDGSAYEPSWNAECKWGLEFDTDCLGHAEQDATVGELSFYNEDTGSFELKHLTNQEILSATKPENTYKLPYVYDAFDYSHCETEGIYFKKVSKTN